MIAARAMLTVRLLLNIVTPRGSDGGRGSSHESEVGSGSSGCRERREACCDEMFVDKSLRTDESINMALFTSANPEENDEVE
jgi:hypothetical protein